MKKSAFILFIIFSLSQFSFAQKVADALRFSSYSNGPVGARALGMGGAYIGVSDDFTASYWNPAGLAQMKRLEFTGGISNLAYSNQSAFYGNSLTEDGSSTALNDLGFVFPFPTIQGSLVFAFGYNKIADYATGLSFSGFNPTSSIIPTLFDADENYDIPFQTFLANTGFYTSVQDSVTQSAITKETGSLGMWSLAGAIDIEENISLGITLNILSGKYTSDRNYVEADTKNVYADTGILPADSAYHRFNKFYYDSHNEMEITGSSFTIGLMYRSDFFRVGLVARTPQVASVKYNYSRAGESVFDATGSWQGGVAPNKQKYSYDAYYDFGVISPWNFGIGASYYPIPQLLLSADVDYSDWTQIEWSEDAELQKENISLQSNFKSVTNYRVGAEFDVPSTDIRVRAGYSMKPSPYKNDPSSFDQQIISGGAGILLQRNVSIDAGISFGKYKTSVYQYSDVSSRVDESISTTQAVVTLSYRF